MTAPVDLIAGQFIRVAIDRQMTAFFTGEATTHTFWVFARYVSTVDRQVVVEHADGERTLVDIDHVHALDTVNARESGGT